MNRQKFMQELEFLLKKLPTEQRLEVLEFYREYFAEAGVENEQKVLDELKSPEHLAAKILAEYAQKQISFKEEVKNKKAKNTNGIKAFWFGALAILAAPIAIPLMIGLLSILFSLAIVVLVLIPTLAIITFALIVAFVFSIFVLPIQALYFLAWIIILFAFIRLFLLLAKAGLNKIFIKIKSL